MKVIIHTNPHKFFQTIHPFLKENEALNNLMLGTAFNMTNPESPHASKERWMYSIEDNGQIVYATLSIAPRSLIIAARNEYIERGNSLVIRQLRESGVSLPGTIGEKTACMDFAKKWCEHQAINYRIISNMGVFQLDKVADISLPKGRFRLGKTEEEDLVTEWILGFDRELFGEQTPESARKAAKAKLKRQLLYFWEVDGEVVSTAAGTRPTDSCMTISSVYTPPKHRKKGYARSCVAQLSQTMLDKGYQLCALFTDLANPTSNKIYKEIGYYQVGEFVNLIFE